jgi:nitrogen fixation protein FixH
MPAIVVPASSSAAAAAAASAAAASAAPTDAAPLAADVRIGRWWVRGVVAVLGGIVALNLWVIRLAAADGGVNAEPDYYRKAVAWDAQQAAAAASAALGWRADGAVAARAGDLTVLRLRLVDAAGAPVRDAVITVTARWNGDATHAMTGTAIATGDGYTVALPLTRSGLHELRLDATRGGDRFGQVLKVDVPVR